MLWSLEHIVNKRKGGAREPFFYDFQIRDESEGVNITFILERRFDENQPWEKLGSYRSVLEAQNAVDKALDYSVPNDLWKEIDL